MANRPLHSAEDDKRTPLYVYLAAAASKIALACGALSALFAILFLSNFNFENFAHLGIFVFDILTPLLVIGSAVFFYYRQNALSGSLLIASYLAVIIAWYLWTIPAARGLMH